MKATKFLLLALLLPTLALAEKKAAGEMPSIFTGNDLTGWEVPKENIWWSAADGILAVKSGPKKKGSTLWTEKSYRDFEVSMDFKMGEGTVDSGVFLRTEKQQIQIGISGSLKRDMTCSPYIPGKGYPVEAEGIKELLKEKDWNHLKIRALGPKYTVWLNGKQVLDYTSEKAPEEGKIGLQLHGGKEMAIEFRDIRARRIE